LKSIILQIADTHAFTNKTLDKERLEMASNKLENILKKIKYNLGIEALKIMNASEIENDNLHKKIEDKINKQLHTQNAYIKKEVADIEFFRKKNNSNIKLSWIIPGEENRGNDERLFDQLHSETFGKVVNFLHIQPGHTFDEKFWRTSPYIHRKGERRTLLKKNEKVINKMQNLNNNSTKAAKNHLKNIVRCFESLLASILNKNLEEKIELIISRCLR
jgi:hypothetical protein